jgi:hypothetical protein
MTDRERLAMALKLAKEATNGWGIFAKRKTEHAEIARLHRAISDLEKAGDASEPKIAQDNKAFWHLESDV